MKSARPAAGVVASGGLEMLVGRLGYSEEEGRSDLAYIIDLWEGGRDLYEVELGGIYVP
jgi:hypothetical protein